MIDAAQRRYLRIEMTVAAVISAVLSGVFVLLLFGGRDPVPVHGWNGLIVDAVPQGLMIALMSSLIPTLLTRRRVAAGAVRPSGAAHRLPSSLVVRSGMIAVAAGLSSGLLHWILLPLAGDAWRFGAVLAMKIAYGAVLGAGVARVAVVAALADPVRSSR